MDPRRARARPPNGQLHVQTLLKIGWVGVSREGYRPWATYRPCQGIPRTAPVKRQFRLGRPAGAASDRHSDPASKPRYGGCRRVRRRESSNAPNGYDRRHTNAKQLRANRQQFRRTVTALINITRRGAAQLRMQALTNAACVHTYATGSSLARSVKDVSPRDSRASDQVDRSITPRVPVTRTRPIHRPMTSSSDLRAWPAVGGEYFHRAARQTPYTVMRARGTRVCYRAILRADAVRTRASRAALPHSHDKAYICCCPTVNEEMVELDAFFAFFALLEFAALAPW